MRFLGLIVFFTVFSFAFGQVKWMTMEQALEAQKTQPKKILINFVTQWCQACKTMENNTFSHPEIAQYLNTHYYAVKFDTESQQKVNLYGKTFTNTSAEKKNHLHDFAKFMNVNATPSLVFLDENSAPITILQGMLTAKELEPYLPFFIHNDYKKITTRKDWDSYQKKFKSKIKD
ncbi:thioredoxin [Bergeyella porcorum]|uniref:Thioredoxin n=1 Tax=Bergeyella porcorum TaxID=1735111 RepID=A0AAU0F288_9FLAO